MQFFRLLYDRDV